MKESSVFVSESVFHASLPFHYISKGICLGFYKFNVNGKAFEVLAQHKVAFLFAVASWIGLTVYSAFSKYLIIFDGEEAKSNFLQKVSFFEMVLEMCFALGIIIFHQTRIDRIYKFLVNLNNFDEAMLKFKWRFVVQNSCRYFVIVIASALFIVSSTLVYRLTQNRVDLSELFLLMVFQANLLLLMAVIGQFITSILAVKTRMFVLLKNVQYLLPLTEADKSDIQTVSGRISFQRKIINDVMKAYNYLINAVEELNQIFSVEMMALFALSLLFEITILYQALRTAMDAAAFFSMDMFYGSIFLVVVYIAPTVFSVFMSFYLIDWFQTFTSHIAECANNIKTEDTALTLQMQLLMDLLKLRPIKISCGFFDINLPLLLSNIVVVGNYLVIICQFEISQQASSSANCNMTKRQ